MKLSELKPLFWKEWHENIRWALLALLALSLGLAYAIYNEVGRAGFVPNGGTIPVWGSVNLVMTIGIPIIGLALGLLQILPELRRDQWAFLMHRPVSRTTLFLGKVLPGLCLYLLAVVSPLLGVAAWDAVPGHVAAPFDFQFTLGGWAAILSGLSFYFAGLLVALRPARWYGSRALPILAALMGPFAADWYNEFWQVLLSFVAVIGVLAVTAWGSFVTSGNYREQTKPAQFTLGVTLYIGILVCMAALIAFSVMASEALFPLPDSAFLSTQYRIEASGRILRVTTDRRGDVIKTTDLLGHILSDPARGNGVETDDPYLNVSNISPDWWPNLTRSDHYNDPAHYALPLQTYLYRHTDTSWYYVYGIHQIVGYSLATRLPVVYLGPHGFSPTSERAGQFSEPLRAAGHRDNTTAFLQFPHAVYCFNTDKQTLMQLWSNASTNALEGVGYLNGIGIKIQNDAYVIAADNRIQVFSGEGTLRFDLPRPVSVGSDPEFQAAMDPTGSRYYFWYASKNSLMPNWGDASSKLITVASSGRILQTMDLPALMSARVETPTPAALGLLMPPALPTVYAGSVGILHAAGYPDTNGSWRSLRQDKSLPGVLLFSFLSVLPAAVLAWRISRRCGDNRRSQILWAVGAFWLGLYGVLLLLALRAWPARIPCPNCGRLRVVDRDLCEHCGAAFARPKRDGTEIFDGENVGEVTILV